MNSRRPLRPQKRVIFVGCEGQSEVGYVALIQDFAKEQGIPVHLHIEDLSPKAGDPLKRVQRSIQQIEQVKRTRVAPELRFLFLDEDQVSLNFARAAEAKETAAKHKINLIWQSPCFEALLLRHLPNCQNQRPPDTRSSILALSRIWPDYQKGLPRAKLAAKIKWESVQQAANIEKDLDRFLRALGFTL